MEQRFDALGVLLSPVELEVQLGHDPGGEGPGHSPAEELRRALQRFQRSGPRGIVSFDM